MDLTLLEKNYKDISILPCKSGSKDPKDVLWNFKRYKTTDFTETDNVAIHTGSEVFSNLFSLVLDIDFDVTKYPIVKKIIFENCKDTVIVKSGGKHNGLHVHYLSDVPIRSSNITFKFGIIEIKGIDSDGTVSAIILPPSIVLNKYEVINPEKSDFIDFKKVKKINISILNKLLSKLKKEINENRL